MWGIHKKSLCTSAVQEKSTKAFLQKKPGVMLQTQLQTFTMLPLLAFGLDGESCQLSKLVPYNCRNMHVIHPLRQTLHLLQPPMATQMPVLLTESVLVNRKIRLLRALTPQQLTLPDGRSHQSKQLLACDASFSLVSVPALL